MLNCLIYDVRRYIDETKSAAKERVYEYRIEQNQNLQKAGQVLKLFTNESIAGDTPFHQVQAKAFSILAREASPKATELRIITNYAKQYPTPTSESCASKLNMNRKSGMNVAA